MHWQPGALQESGVLRWEIDREALREAPPAASPLPSPLLVSWGLRSKCQAVAQPGREQGQNEEEERLVFQALGTGVGWGQGV